MAQADDPNFYYAGDRREVEVQDALSVLRSYPFLSKPRPPSTREPRPVEVHERRCDAFFASKAAVASPLGSSVSVGSPGRTNAAFFNELPPEPANAAACSLSESIADFSPSPPRNVHASSSVTRNRMWPPRTEDQPPSAPFPTSMLRPATADDIKSASFREDGADSNVRTELLAKQLQQMQSLLATVTDQLQELREKCSSTESRIHACDDAAARAAAQYRMVEKLMQDSTRSELADRFAAHEEKCCSEVRQVRSECLQYINSLNDRVDAHLSRCPDGVLKQEMSCQANITVAPSVWAMVLNAAPLLLFLLLAYFIILMFRIVS